MRQTFGVFLVWASLCGATLAAGEAAHVDGFAAAFRAFADSQGRVWVVADRTGDGKPDVAYAFTSRSGRLPADVVAELPRTVSRGAISLLSDRVVAAENAVRGAGWRIEMSLNPAHAEQRTMVLKEGPDRVLVLADGTALTRYSELPISSGGGTTFETFEAFAAEVVTVEAPVSPLDCPQCSAGGKGSTQCSAQCSYSGGVEGKGLGTGGGISAMTSKQCSVECGDGYFACCNCSFSIKVGEVGIVNACACISTTCGNK